ncbi:hypothetical protein ACO0RG_000206 [Hanseniaspora osmophila]
MYNNSAQQYSQQNGFGNAAQMNSPGMYNQPQPTGFVQPQGTGYFPPAQPNQQQQPQTGGFMQPQNTGYFQQQLQTPSLPLRTPTATEFSEFQQNKPESYGMGSTTFGQPLQQNSTGYNFQQPQLSQPQQQSGSNVAMPTTSFGNLTTGQQNDTLTPLQPQQTGFYSSGLQPQQTGYYSSNHQVEPLKPNATGFVNSMANTGTFNNTLKLPNRRLSFVTLVDQQKFEKLFRSKVPSGSNTISGKNCRDILIKSGLPPKQLAQIWNLADSNKAGELLFPEFVLAMYLVNSVLHGEPLPYAVERKIGNEVTSFVDAINFMVGEEANEQSAPPQLSNPTPFDNLTAGLGNLQPQPTGMMPSISFGGNAPLLQQQYTGGVQPQQTGVLPQTTGGTLGTLQPQNTGFMPQTSFGQQVQMQLTGAPPTSFGFGGQQPTGLLQPQTTGYGLVAQPTGFLPQSSFNPTAPLVAQKTGFGNNELYSQSNFASKFNAENDDFITAEEKALFYKIFETYDSENSGLLDSPTAVEIFRKSGLNRSDLEHIWNLADANNSGKLNRQEFAVGMHLVYRRLNGYVLPTVLPRSLVPKSTQIIDLMKDQLKDSSGVDNQKDSKSSTINSSGSSYRNRDELPQFKSRRSENVLPTQKQVEDEAMKNQEEQEIKELKKLIRDKKILIDGEIARNEQRASRNDNEKIQDLTEIETIKSQITSLPNPEGGAASSTEQKGRYDSLKDKVSQVLAEITLTEEAITSAKIQLYRKKNPSSIVGTGPNGEVTDFDRKKAKRKAILAERMASLTGKPVAKTENLEEENQRLEQAVQQIKQESLKNAAVVNDIKTTIDEIVSGVSDLYGSNARTPESEKYELGLGLRPEVKTFIKQLQATKLKASYTNKNISQSSSPAAVSGSPSLQASSPVSSEAQKEASYSDFKTPAERAAYIKEQAQKRMSERLAKLGLNRRGGRRDRGSDEPSPPPPASVSAPQTVSSNIFEEAGAQENADLNVSSTASLASSSNASPIVNREDDHSQEEVDEEEQALMKKLAAIKQKKKAKEERMAQLKKEIEQAEKADEKEALVSAPGISTTATQEIPLPSTNNSVSEVGQTVDDNDGWSDSEVTTHAPPPPPLVPVLSNASASQHHNGNPFSKPNGDEMKKPVAEASKMAFFQQSPSIKASTSSGFDTKAAELQRRMQRGLDNEDDDDGWSDDEVKTGLQASVAEQTANATLSSAPPIPKTQPLPTAPPLPQTPANSTPELGVPPPPPSLTAQPAKSQVSKPPVPVAPPIPSLDQQPKLANSEQTHPDVDDDDDLSIPESVSSDDDDGDFAGSSIPAPPPLPQF